MKMPINYTHINPSVQLTMELSRLAQIAAGAKAIGHIVLETQAREAYNNLVSKYNEQLPTKKPKGFWAQFKDNITFSDLDCTFVQRLSYLDDSNDYKTFCGIFSNMNRAEAVDIINKIISREF